MSLLVKSSKNFDSIRHFKTTHLNMSEITVVIRFNETFVRQNIIPTFFIFTFSGERPYKCRYCGKGFTQYGTVQAHERTHTGKKPYPCKQCDKRFITSSHLRWHIKRHHAEVKEDQKQ